MARRSVLAELLEDGVRKAGDRVGALPRIDRREGATRSRTGRYLGPRAVM
jgi:hypothetical protein